MSEITISGRYLAVARFAVIATCAVMVPLTMPLLVSSCATLFEVSPERAGYFAVAEMLGSGIGATLVVLLVARFRWNAIFVPAFALMILVNFGTLSTTDFHYVLTMRVLSGLCAGVCLGLATAGLARLGNPERNLALFFLAAFGTSSLALRLLPGMIEQHGPLVPFYVLLGSAIVGCVLAAGIKAPAEAAGEVGSTEPHGALAVSPIVLVCVASVLLLFMGIGATWTFFSSVGAAVGLETSVIAKSMSTAAIFGGIGALAAVGAAGRAPRLGLLVIGIGAVCVAVVLLIGSITESSFMIAGVLLLFGWNFGFPFLLGMLADLDPRGRLVPLGVAMSSFGFAAGPALASSMLGEQVAARVGELGVLLVMAALAAALLVELRLQVLRRRRATLESPASLSG